MLTKSYISARSTPWHTQMGKTGRWDIDRQTHTHTHKETHSKGTLPTFLYNRGMAIKAFVMMWWSASASASMDGKCEESEGPVWSNTIHTNPPNPPSFPRLPSKKKGGEIRKNIFIVLSSFVWILWSSSSLWALGAEYLKGWSLYPTWKVLLPSSFLLQKICTVL